MMITWDKIFETGEIPNNISDIELCAKALGAWGCCSLGKPPENFGVAMAQIASRLEIEGTPESFMQYAKSKGF